MKQIQFEVPGKIVPKGIGKVKATNDQIISAYQAHKSVWKAAKALGMCGQSVHERLQRLGANNSINILTIEEKDKIRYFYSNSELKRGDGQLDAFAKALGRTKNFISRYARSIGLTSYNRGSTADHAKRASERMKLQWQSMPHPKGMLGKKHSKETKERFSKIRMGRKMSPESVMKTLKTKFKRGNLISFRKSSWKQGWRQIGSNRIFARSRWEANFGRYLEFLKRHGEIQSWEHEAECFWFEKIRRGCRSYLPDFKVLEKNGEYVFYEVKGWMDPKSKTKLNRMRIYYPKVKIRLIQKEWFKANRSKLMGLIPDWEDSVF
jgi:hypothetical protein